MKRISVDLYWKLSNENSELINDMIKKKRFYFEPEELIYHDNLPFEKGLIEFSRIDFTQSEPINVIINGKNNQKEKRDRLYFSVSDWGRHKMIKIAIACSVCFNWEMTFIQDFLCIPELICCFVYDNEDEFFQSQESINYYTHNGLDISNLKQTTDRIGRRVIDISRNFGRSKQAIGVKFIAGAKMYFGEIFFKIIPQDRLSGFYFENKYGHNKLYEVQLFELFSDDIQLKRKKQQVFMQNTGMFETAEYLKTNFRGTVAAVNYLGI